MVGNSDFVDEPVLKSYLEEIGSLEGLMKEIVSVYIGNRVQRALDIKGIFFDLRVDISYLMERMKEEPAPQTFGIGMMAGVNLPRIEVPTFDGTILNWRLFWKQFQAAVHDKPYLGEVDKLTYLRDAPNGAIKRST